MIELIWAILAMALTHGRVDGPANGIYAGGEEPEKGERIATSAVTPGCPIIADTGTVGNAVEAGAAATNLLGVAAENLRFDNLESFLTDNPAGQPFQYYMVGTDVFGVIKNSSAALAEGDLLKTASKGFEKFVVGTDDAAKAVARYIGKAAVTPPASGVNRYLIRIGGA